MNEYRCFLSCLCGSERNKKHSVNTDTFLSCLCGSEPEHTGTQAPIQFLSCLCVGRTSASAMSDIYYPSGLRASDIGAND
ncbi:hypothetical protein BZG72_04785 [Salinivibrio sp. PR6]|nr:hypothetical protein BZG72_04785 [Salinivibrio sp. PR6]